MAPAGGQAARDVTRGCQVFFRPQSRVWRMNSHGGQRGTPTGWLAGSRFSDTEGGIFGRYGQTLPLHTPNLLPIRPSKPRKASFEGTGWMEVGLN